MVAPEGTTEIELAQQYQEKAESVKIAGYHRLANALQELVESYKQDSEWIIQQYRTNIKNYYSRLSKRL